LPELKEARKPNPPHGGHQAITTKKTAGKCPSQGISRNGKEQKEGQSGRQREKKVGRRSRTGGTS